METQSTRISKYVIEEIGKIAEGIGNPTDDTAMRHVIAEYKRLKLENEILKNKLAQYENKDVE
jgi:regulator of replication initiation timing